MSQAFGHQLLLLRFRRPSFSPSSTALFCPLFRATAAAFATVGAKKESTAQHQDEQQQKQAQEVQQQQQQQPLKNAKLQMGNNRRTARLTHADGDSADQLAREDWAHFEIVERQLDELLEHHADKLDEEGDVLGVDMVADPLNEPDLSEMETGDETASRPINRFRPILYTEGELDKSDLGQPPSRENPHPFDPSTLPPTHSRNPTPYANHSPTLQMLLELGVNLFEVCQAPKIGRALLRLDPERDVKAKIFWLVKRCGVPEADIGPYLTRNPYFLLQSFDDLKARLDYLQFHRFSRQQIAKLVVEYRYWLNIPQERIDARLGWLQRQFHLRADELRLAIVKEPRLIQFGVGPIQGLILALNQTCGFSQQCLQQIVLKDPRVFLSEKPHVLTSYNYLAYVMRITNEQIVAFPLALRCPLSALRRRHEFLFRLRKANYVPETADHITLEQFCHPSDRFFAEEIARTPIADFNRFIKIV
ncbi:hypothetical protein niasHS_013371 [Heterodera schachtii]|uniref:mTERF domain-containing protein 1, mitochondrial n=1 Tax=Heterodera schachtii TaxID=97005 RepID=A0ABD2I7M3_HETSC